MDHPNQMLGLSPGTTQLLDIDHVSLYSGSLSLAIPIAQGLTLFYNSNIWEYEFANFPFVEASIDQRFNAGTGWMLTMGELWAPDSPHNPSSKWVYFSPDGGSHSFYQQLHRGEDDGDDDVQYTRDGSYLRLVKLGTYVRKIELPDGSFHRFTKHGGHWDLTRIEDAFGNYLDVTSDADDTLRTITDRHGRTHYIHLENIIASTKDVTMVDVESVGGARAVYTFEYRTEKRFRSCKDDDPYNANRITLRLLTRINLPDGSAYTMLDSEGKARYYDTCSPSDDLPGVLAGIELPTLGEIEWTFEDYVFPPADGGLDDTAAGVATRTLRRKDGTAEGTWAYKSTKIPAQGELDPELRTEVVSPTGECTKHFFNARYWLTPSEGRGWEQGLAFVYSEESNGKYLSSQIWDGSGPNGSCTGTKVRSTYLLYDHDQLPGSNQNPDEFTNSNRRVEGQRVVYHDDGDRWTETNFSDFDGLGHYRVTTTTGNFWDGSLNNEERIATTHYNPSRGSYPGSFVPVATTEPWILGTFDYQEVSEGDAVGESVARQEFGHDPQTGILTCTRVLKSGASRSADDILKTYTHDGHGLVTDTKTYGGDLQALPTTGAGCGDLPAQPEYWLKHTYENGTRKTTRPHHSDGSAGPFLTYDVDLDASTGLVLASRDTAGLATTYSYDVMGRQTRMTPPGQADMLTTYSTATAVAPAKVVEQRSSGAMVLAEREVILDDFGRATKQREKLPGGLWSERETLYDASGRRASVSEWGDLAKVTQYLNHDALGRATTIRPPEGATHDVRLTHEGDRRVIKEVKIALDSGETYVARFEEMDGYGRLRKVEEAAGLTGALVSTVYDYDVGGNLTAITSGPSNMGVTQQRLYSYDNRGFLLSETLPEMGPSGNGTVAYEDYDSIGKAHRRTEGANDIAFTHDFLGRPLDVRDVNEGNRLLIRNAYDDPAANGMGRLKWSRRYNWVDLPWDPAGEQDVQVFERFRYDTPSGQVSWTRTRVTFPGEAFKDFDSRYQYDELGEIVALRYPECIHTTCSATVGPAQWVYSEYDQGLLKEVTNWTGTLQYHSSGMLSALPHANGVTDNRDADPDRRRRPYRIYTTGAKDPVTGELANWDSGIYLYDGAGNIKSIGSESFTYDGVQRLVDGGVAGWSEEYAYDAFGNVGAVTTTDPLGQGSTVTLATDTSTNRLSAATYDASGNLTQWGLTSYDYDPLGNMRSLDSRWLYLYNADGLRVAAIDWTSSVPTRKITYTIRGLESRILSRFHQTGADLSGSWARDGDYVYAGALMLAFDNGAEANHFHLDRLGTARLITDESAFTIGRHDYLPYGKEVTTSGDEPMQFTGHERDATGLDYMKARYYNSSLCRFLRIDPSSGKPQRPQSLNRYAYVVGNPMMLVDPDGRDPIPPPDWLRPPGFGDDCTVMVDGVEATDCGPDPAESRILEHVEDVCERRPWQRGCSGNDEPCKPSQIRGSEANTAAAFDTLSSTTGAVAQAHLLLRLAFGGGSFREYGRYAYRESGSGMLQWSNVFHGAPGHVRMPVSPGHSAVLGLHTHENNQFPSYFGPNAGDHVWPHNNEAPYFVISPWGISVVTKDGDMAFAHWEYFGRARGGGEIRSGEDPCPEV